MSEIFSLNGQDCRGLRPRNDKFLIDFSGAFRHVSKAVEMTDKKMVL